MYLVYYTRWTKNGHFIQYNPYKYLLCIQMQKNMNIHTIITITMYISKKKKSYLLNWKINFCETEIYNSIFVLFISSKRIFWEEAQNKHKIREWEQEPANSIHSLGKVKNTSVSGSTNLNLKKRIKYGS